MKKRYFEEIDGIRFYVFLLILINHTGIWNKSQGHTFFFMLSGFLIGYSSFNDIAKHGKFSLKRYLIRRILRTFPLYFLIVLFCGFSYIILKGFGKTITLDGYWSYFFFLHNYFVGDSLFILKNLWAMAVTEQLYFFWGILIFYLQRRILKFIVFLIVFFTGLAFFTGFISWNIYENTLVYSGIYLLGAYCGLLSHKKDWVYHFASNSNIIQSSFFIILSLLIALLGFMMSDEFFVLREYILAFGFWGFLTFICYSNITRNSLMNNRVVKYLGKISYGLYCYHAIVITLVTQLFALKQFTYSAPGLFCICLIITILVAIVSYEFYEKRFLSMKRALR